MNDCYYETLDGEKTREETKVRRRVVEAVNGGSGDVDIKVNGVLVAAFNPGHDYLDIYSPETEKTGLAEDEHGRLKVRV